MTKMNETMFYTALDQFLRDGFCYLPNDDHWIYMCDTLRDLNEDFITWPADEQNRVRFDRGQFKYCSESNGQYIRILKVGTLEEVTRFYHSGTRIIDDRYRLSPLFDNEDAFMEWYQEQMRDANQSMDRYFSVKALDVVDEHYLQAKYLLHVSNA